MVKFVISEVTPSSRGIEMWKIFLALQLAGSFFLLVVAIRGGDLRDERRWPTVGAILGGTIFLLGIGLIQVVIPITLDIFTRNKGTP